MIEIIEQKMLSDSLIGKSRDHLFSLFELEDTPSLLYGLSHLTKSNWHVHRDEIIRLYFLLNVNKNLTKIEKIILKKNAKKGFPIVRPRLSPETQRPAGKAKRKPQKNQQRRPITIDDVNYKSDIIQLRGKKVRTICKIYFITLEQFNALCHKEYTETSTIDDGEFTCVLPILRVLKRNLNKPSRKAFPSYKVRREKLLKQLKTREAPKKKTKQKRQNKSRYTDSVRSRIMGNSIGGGSSIHTISTGMKD